jgi:NAD(P)H-hydrate epimerase
MIPVVTPDEMRAIDAAAPESLDVLVGRAGGATHRAALDMLGGTYGRRVHVIAGRGNNGADGRDAARRLRARGVRVLVHEVATCPEVLPPSDLVIDAAFGTGFRVESARPWTAPDTSGAPVLAVDIPSGVDAGTGQAVDGAMRADRTITFHALKPGMLFGEGATLVGDVDVVDIGLDASNIRCHRVERVDVSRWWPARSHDAHKWRHAVMVIAGSPGMPGAAELCTAAAARGGAGLVSLAAPGCRPRTRSEIVQQEIGFADFSDEVLADMGRFASLVVGPGLGRHDATLVAARHCVADAPVPVVVDGDALFGLAWSDDGAAPLLRRRRLPTVLTPHDGEFMHLTGHRPPLDRIAAVRSLAADVESTILLKGPTTVVATPAPGDEIPSVLLVDHGDERLATAGSGDVLAGLIGTALAAGVEPGRAAAAAAWLHAEAAHRRPRAGLLAGDIIDALPEAIEALR